MSRVLVTGAAGFMGSHITEYLVKAKRHKVVAVDDLSGGFRDNVPEEAEFVAADLAKAGTAESLFRVYGPFDYVYHLAAYAAEGLSHFIRVYNYNDNLIASVQLINQAVLHKVKRFIFTSSIAVYGSQRPPFKETTQPKPEDPYGISKYAVELDLQAASKQFGLEYTIFRPHNVYGVRQNIADPYRNVIGIFIRQCLSGEPMTIFGDGTQNRAFTYIDNVTKKIARAPEIKATTNEVFNVGADEPYTVLELANIVAEECGVDCVVKFLPKRNEADYAYCNHSKITKIFPQRNPITLRTGIQRTISWVKEHGIPEPTSYSNIEVPVNMPPSWQNALKVSN